MQVFFNLTHKRWRSDVWGRPEVTINVGCVNLTDPAAGDLNVTLSNQHFIHGVRHGERVKGRPPNPIPGIEPDLQNTENLAYTSYSYL